MNQIKTTNLSILREILEGNYDYILNDVNNSNNEVELKTNKDKSKKQNQKVKNKLKRKTQSQYFLRGDDEFIKDWLKRKKRISRQKKVEKERKNNEDKVKNELLNKENEERLAQARESYDKWLKDIRNRNKENRCKCSIPEVRMLEKSQSAEESYNKWLTNKKTLECKEACRKPELLNLKVKIDSVPEIKQVHARKVDKAVSPMKLDVRNLTVSGKCQPNKSKTEPTSEIVDENFQSIVNELRKEKWKQKERSKKRVDSGIAFSREKEVKNELVITSRDEFTWRMAIEENGPKSEFVEPCKSDCRSRRVDLITHDHENPFADKNLVKSNTVI